MKQSHSILGIVMPVHNEKDSIEIVLTEWKNELEKYAFSYTFIICEDGSTDGTKELLEKIKAKYPLFLNQKDYRRGYGRAVMDGITSATTEYVLCIDSDGQCDPGDFHTFWQHKDTKDVIIGHRTKRKDPLQRKLFSFLFKTVFYLLFPTHIKDPSAPFVLFKRNTILPHLAHLRHLKEGFWWGFAGMCVKKGLSIHEIPIKHRKRFKGTTHVYHAKHIISIALRNLIGLCKLRFLS